jgi:hypothetical protein
MAVQQTMLTINRRPRYAGATVKIVIGIIALGALIAVNFGSSKVRYIRIQSPGVIAHCIIVHRII